MSGTKSTDDEQTRADHEAGHFIVAHVLGVMSKPLWISIVPFGDAGGSMGITRKGDSPLVPTLQYYLGGIAGEAVGFLHRKYQRNPPTEMEMKKAITDSLVRAFEDGGHGDNMAIEALLRGIPKEQHPNLVDLLWQTLDPIHANKDIFFELSKQVRRYKNLYQSAPLYFMKALKGGPKRQRLADAYEYDYWARKTPVEAPENWPLAEPFYEGPDEYFDRMGKAYRPGPRRPGGRRH